MTPPSPTEATLAAVHLAVGQAMGRLCLALTRRRVRPGDVTAWADVLRAAARELDALASETRRNE